MSCGDELPPTPQTGTPPEMRTSNNRRPLDPTKTGKLPYDNMSMDMSMDMTANDMGPTDMGPQDMVPDVVDDCAGVTVCQPNEDSCLGVTYSKLCAR